MVEGRFIYDCFVLNEKADAIYYHGGQQVLKDLVVVTAATDTGKSTIVVNGQLESGHKWYYDTATSVAGLIGVTYGSAITTGNWTELTANGLEITPTAGDLYIRVVDVTTADSKPVAVGDALLNIG